MESKKLAWFGTYTPGVHDGSAIDSIVRGDLMELESEFAHCSLDDPLLLDLMTVATPISAAISSGNVESLRWLLDRGARLDTKHSNAFLDAARHGTPELLRELASKGANIHADRGFGDAFTRALIGERTGNFATIHELGHDAATYGGPAFLHAVYQKNGEAIAFLLDHGADVNFSGSTPVFGNDETPLHVAVRGGDVELVRLLKEAGADIGATDYHGNRPYDAAVQSGALDIARYLRSFEAAERHTRAWTLSTPAAEGLPAELVAFLESDDRTLRAAANDAPVGWIDFLPLTDTVAVRVGRTRTVLRLSREVDNYSVIWIVWSPRLARIGVVVSEITLKFYRLGTWDQYRADPFVGIDRILSGEAKPTSA